MNTFPVVGVVKAGTLLRSEAAGGLTCDAVALIGGVEPPPAVQAAMLAVAAAADTTLHRADRRRRRGWRSP